MQVQSKQTTSNFPLNLEFYRKTRISAKKEEKKTTQMIKETRKKIVEMQKKIKNLSTHVASCQLLAENCDRHIVEDNLKHVIEDNWIENLDLNQVPEANKECNICLEERETHQFLHCPICKQGVCECCFLAHYQVKRRRCERRFQWLNCPFCNTQVNKFGLVGKNGLNYKYFSELLYK